MRENKYLRQFLAHHRPHENKNEDKIKKKNDHLTTITTREREREILSLI